jgi:predicted RNA binding protein YcfA (HicA-like mRNA interferase family)
MTRLPTITGKQLIAVLQRLGFETIRVRGSHHYLRHRDGRSTLVPVHSGEDLGRGLMSKILRAADISREELMRNL